MKSLKTIIVGAGMILLACLPARADVTAAPDSANFGGAMEVQELKLILNAYSMLAVEQMSAIQRELRLLAVTKEVQTEDWDSMKGLMSEYSRSGANFAAVWYARPDGTYYTVENGLMRVKLSDRDYFPSLMSGKEVAGEVLISKSTGKRSAAFAVPVKKGGKVVGAVGVTMSLEDMSKAIDETLLLPPDMLFYALDTKGQVSLHRDTRLLLVFPSDLGSKTLDTAIAEMLSKPEGVVKYKFRGDKTVVFKRMGPEGWTYAVGVISGPETDK